VTIGVEEDGDGEVRGVVQEQPPLLTFSAENENTTVVPSTSSVRRTVAPGNDELEDFPVMFN
jgi:hypothetical protein